MRTIAVIEDNPDNSLLIKLILEDRYRLQMFENGTEALMAFPNDPPDLVLMDISLPGIDGIEVLKRMKIDEQLKHIPVIALTANALRMDLNEYLSSGFNNYVAKPILDENVLFQAISALIR